MTPFWTHSFAMRARGAPPTPPTYDKWFSGGQTDIQHFFTAAAEELYLPGVPASGPITGSIAGNVLTPVTTPHWQQPLTGLAGDPLGVSFDVGATDSFDAANSSVHDYATSAFAVLVTLLFTATPPTLQRDIVGKRASGPLGWDLRSAQASGLIAAFMGATGFVTRTAAVSSWTSVHYALLWYSATLGACALDTDDVMDATQAYAKGSMSSGAVFSLGSSAATAAPVVVGPTVIWSGANAETVIANRATTLPAWWAS